MTYNVFGGTLNLTQACSRGYIAKMVETRAQSRLNRQATKSDLCDSVLNVFYCRWQVVSRLIITMLPCLCYLKSISSLVLAHAEWILLCYTVFVYQFVSCLALVHLDVYIETLFSVQYMVAFILENIFTDTCIIDIFHRRDINLWLLA